jgi:hypothetical protein
MSLSFNILMYFVLPKSVCVLLKLIFRSAYAFRGYFIAFLLVSVFCVLVHCTCILMSVTAVSFPLIHEH